MSCPPPPAFSRIPCAHVSHASRAHASCRVPSGADLTPACPQALTYLVLISEVDETEIFKICLEYWNVLAGDLYRENPFTSPTNPFPFMARVSSQPQGRRALYSGVLTKVGGRGRGEVL